MSGTTVRLITQRSVVQIHPPQPKPSARSPFPHGFPSGRATQPRQAAILQLQGERHRRGRPVSFAEGCCTCGPARSVGFDVSLRPNQEVFPTRVCVSIRIAVRRVCVSIRIAVRCHGGAAFINPARRPERFFLTSTLWVVDRKGETTGGRIGRRKHLELLDLLRHCLRRCCCALPSLLRGRKSLTSEGFTSSRKHLA